MKRIAVSVIGGVLLIAGVAMLVLPGPGMVLCAAGLGVLATEYEWARRSLGWAQDRAREGIERTGSSLWLTLGSVACGLVLIGIGIAEIIVNLPLLNIVTAALMIAGGLFLTLSSFWARYQQTHAPS
jgi:Putative transmembrane protein (PGPGW)